MTFLFEPINLDDLSVDPNDYIEAAAVLSRYAAYADAKGRAMQHRIDGDIEAAVAFEKTAETTYRRLPQWAKW